MEYFPDAFWLTLGLTVRLAAMTTLILLVVGIPLGWYLASARHRLKPVLEALVSMPLVLPPTVLGFYLLVAMGPSGPLGQLTQTLGLGTLPFTFWGLVVASAIYSLPFVVQPIQNAMVARCQHNQSCASCQWSAPMCSRQGPHP